MRTLTDIQTQVRVYINDSQFILTDNTSDKNKGLNISNEVYLRLSTIYSWPEFVRTDTSITTLSGTSSYDWPTTPKFSNILNIELKNEFDEFEIVPKVENELDWNYFSRSMLNFPSVYRFESVGSQKKITFAPTPLLAKSVKIRGVVEPDKFVNGDSVTIFDSEVADNVLEYLIAASILFKRNFTDRALIRLRQGSSLLNNYTGKEFTPEELDPRAVSTTSIQANAS
jgi:hypothetical protein